MFGEAWTFKLPATFHSLGLSISMEVKIQYEDRDLEEFIEFKDGSFKVLKDATTRDNIGAKSIKVILSDSAGTKKIYSFLLQIIDDPNYVEPEDPALKAPWPTISVN